MSKYKRTPEERQNLMRIVKMFMKSMLVGIAMVLVAVCIYQFFIF
ncbi:hypothetical protein [Fusibacter paucivorans]|nr:hypothetical protein [Fusibacter paucivorans]